MSMKVVAEDYSLKARLLYIDQFSFHFFFPKSLDIAMSTIFAEEM